MAHHETPLWEKVYMGRYGRVYLNAGRLIGHLGCSPFAFWDAAKLLPGFDKLRYENAVRDLTVWSKREQEGRYELHATAKKILRVILGPAPDAPDFKSWWTARLISVKDMKERGLPVEWAEEPPVPLEPVVNEEPKPKARKPAAKKVKNPQKPAGKKGR